VQRVLIAGCGYVGAAAADLFHAAGWAVEGWTHSTDSALALMGKPYPVRSIDISALDQVAAYSAGEFEAIVHCASTRGGDIDAYRRVYRDGARNLLSRFADARFLLASSTSVYAQKNGEWVTEQSPADPEHETGKILRETELFVLGSGGTVARLAGIYGPGRSALLKKFLRGQAIANPETDRFINQVHRDDAAGALVLLLGRAPTPAEIYNLVDDKPVRESEYYKWLAERLERPLPPPRTSSSSRKRGESNKRVSNRKLRAAGWAPKFPSFIEGMEESVLTSFGLERHLRQENGEIRNPKQ
jgi:nucleoside-diphosphate-sugar epimerase